MSKRVFIICLISVLGLLCVHGSGGCVAAQDQPDPGPLPAVALVNAYPKLSFDKPLFYCHDGTGNGLVYVVEQDGVIWRFKNEETTSTKTKWLDISARIPKRKHNEEGLLALAFHPKFDDNGYFYINYSQHKGAKPRRGVTSRFTYDHEEGEVNLRSESIILEVTQPWGNHNGCMLLFGADGYLYLSFGDGGSAGDPHDNSLNLGTLLGTVLRIDVDKEENGKLYGIPKDNPFVDDKDARPEIWAYGLRNVWRMSFDAETGLLWGGDVGQNSYEEIDIIVKGGNYGWNEREGKHAYNGGDKTKDMIDPVAEYSRRYGISVTGGYVYRGTAQQALVGLYVYADYATGRVWGLKYDADKQEVLNEELLGHFPSATISSFGEDADKELYACAHRRGLIYKVVAVKQDDKEEEDGF